MDKFKVWTCKIVVAGDEEIPDGFDNPPRRAAMSAIESHGINVLSCFSGWSGTLTKAQAKIIKY
jgi:hypothetical protein